jgi:hypothetical protein
MILEQVEETPPLPGVNGDTMAIPAGFRSTQDNKVG